MKLHSSDNDYTTAPQKGIIKSEGADRMTERKVVDKMKNADFSKKMVNFDYNKIIYYSDVK